MSNEPTRRKLFHVDIKQERVAPVLCYFVLSMIVTEVYEIRFLVAGIWCLLMFPLWWLGWWLGKRLWERKGGQYEYSQVERIFNSSLDHPDCDNWVDYLVQLAFYEDGGNTDTAGMGDLYQ